MNEVKEGKNIPTVENSLCKALEAEKSMEGLRKARVAAGAESRRDHMRLRR